MITDKKSLSSLLQAAPVVVVYLYGPHCAACKSAGKVLEGFGQETGIPVISIDVEQYPSMAFQFSICSLPTVVICKGGQPWQTVTEITITESVE